MTPALPEPAARTALAWRRTALAGWVLVLLLINHATGPQGPAMVLVSFAAAASAFLVVVVAAIRSRQLHAERYDHGRWAVRSATVSVLLTAGIAGLLVVVTLLTRS